MDERIEDLTQWIESLLDQVQVLLNQGENIPEDVAAMILKEVESAYGEIQKLQSQVEGFTVPQAPIETPLPASAQLLWHLSGRNPEVFAQYLGNFPDPQLNALRQNPDQLQNIIERLQQQFPLQEELPVQDGVEKSPINSSNVWGFAYSPKDQKLRVKFNSGSVYQYDGIRPAIFSLFQQGAVPAKTNGQNQWGRWWKGKKPSIGASMYELIRLGNYPYQRLQ